MTIILLHGGYAGNELDLWGEAEHAVPMRVLEDVRLGFRALRREPLFSFTAILVLALSMGANASVFCVVKSILLAPLAMKNPEELVALDLIRPDGTRYPFNLPYFLALRRSGAGMAEMAAYGGWNVNLTSEAEPQRVLGVRATGNYFQMLGVSAEVGRLLEPEDDRPDRPRVVVITDSLWRRLFAADPQAIGKKIRLNGDPFTLVGVLPPDFQFKTPGQELVVPLAPESDPFRATWNSTAFLRVSARLAPGVTAARARAQLNAAAADIRRQHPVEMQTIVGIDTTKLRDYLTGDSRGMLIVLMCAVAMVLAIACANISSLMLARSVGRSQEISVRMALGAPRWWVARQMLVENLLLFAAGGVAGVLLAGWGVQLLLSITPTELPRLREVRLDWVVVAVALAATMICGLLAGSIPAWRSQQGDVAGALRGIGRGNTAGRSRSRVRAILVVAEAALSLVLLAGAGLLLKSFDRLLALDPGFRSDRLTTLRLALPSTRYKTAAAVAGFHDVLRGNILSLPGVEAAGATSILPLSGPLASADFTIVGRPPVSAKEKPTANYRMVDSTYFHTMGIVQKSGRGFLDSDTSSSQAVVVISEAVAFRYWRGENPVGSRLRMEDNTAAPRVVEVVGVVGNTRETSLEEAPAAVVYVSMAQIPQDVVRFLTNNMFWAIRTANR
ncbi:MAG TPA: ADOP family duplicated permease, partial [Bryobacteraceae bacterium]